MIENKITYWRSMMNGGKGVSRAHFARQVGVSRSYVSKLEKGKVQPGAEFMLRAARYFKQPVEDVFHQIDADLSQSRFRCAIVIPYRQSLQFTSGLANRMETQSATAPARPAGLVSVRDKSPVGPAAKAVASPVALASRRRSSETD